MHGSAASRGAQLQAVSERLKLFHIQFYAVNKNGEHGAGSLWGKHNDGRPMQYAVHDGTKARLVRTTPMFDEAGGDY